MVNPQKKNIVCLLLKDSEYRTSEREKGVLGSQINRIAM